MPNIFDFNDVLMTYNFLNQGIITPSSGMYNVSYYYLSSASELSSTIGYDIDNVDSDGALDVDKPQPNIEYLTFSQTTASQQAMFAWAFAGGTNSVVFTDVVSNLAFFPTLSSALADINIGQVLWESENGDPNDDDKKVPAYTIETLNTLPDTGLNPPYSREYYDKSHGDIWLNSNWNKGWSNTEKDDSQSWTIMHEIGHALGLKGDTLISGSPIDNQKYTIMSYKPYSEMFPTIGEIVYPTGLQLFDILAIQEIFGERNYATRSSSNTYTVTNMNFSADKDDPFLYTIWDGGGYDTIDVSSLSIGAQIDLRQGRFSSIGYDATPFGLGVINWDSDATTADPDPGNVAIAYHTVIENATGTAQGDILIGNAWGNVLEGRDGNDTLYGDGVVYDGEAGFSDPDLTDPNDPNHTKPDSDDDILDGGDGNDTAAYSDVTGVGIHVVMNDKNGTVTTGSDVDTLISIERITGSAQADYFSGGNGKVTFIGGDGGDVYDLSVGNITVLERAGDSGIDVLTSAKFNSTYHCI